MRNVISKSTHSEKLTLGAVRLSLGLCHNDRQKSFKPFIHSTATARRHSRDFLAKILFVLRETPTLGPGNQHRNLSATSLLGAHFWKAPYIVLRGWFLKSGRCSTTALMKVACNSCMLLQMDYAPNLRTPLSHESHPSTSRCIRHADHG